MKNNPALKTMIEAIKHMPLLTFMILLSVAGAIIASLLPPLVLERIVNLLTNRQDISLLLIISYFALLTLSGLLESAREVLLSVFGQKITHYLRSSLCDKLTRLPADTIVKTEPGITASRFVGDVDTVEELFTSGIISMFADACKMISILVILFIKNKGLALLLLIVLPLIYLFTRIVQKRTLKAQKDNRKAIGKASNHVPETIKTIRMVHALKIEKYMQKVYDNMLEDSFKAIEKTNFYDSIYSPVILILNAFMISFVMILAATGNTSIQSFFGMSVGTSVAVISYISQVFSPIESIGMEIQTIQQASAGVHRINEFLLQEERIISNQEQTINKEEICINIQDVDFSYDHTKKIFNHLNLRINKGEQVTITGRTGAGKSTIFKLLLGLYIPDHGSITIYGKDASSITDKQKRKIFGYVEQAFYLVPGTIKDQIQLFDLSISDEEIYEASKLVGLHDTILTFEKGYDTPCKKELFSQGQIQLLSIARAIVSKPDILLLDEITANLDADTELMVLNALKNASQNRTVLSISHRLYEHMGGRELVVGNNE